MPHPRCLADVVRCNRSGDPTRHSGDGCDNSLFGANYVGRWAPAYILFSQVYVCTVIAPDAAGASLKVTIHATGSVGADIMISTWWVLWAFILGGYAGALLVGLMAMGSRHDEDRAHERRGIKHSRGEMLLRRRHGPLLHAGR